MSSTSTDSPAPNQATLQATRVQLRPIANPLVLGFVGVAVATLMASGTELNWIPLAQRHQAAVLIIAFAPALQLVSSVFGFLARDAIAATALGTQAAAWSCVGLSLLLSVPGSHSEALALLVVTAGTALILTSAIGVQAKLLPSLVIALTGVRLILTGIFEFGNGSGWGHAAGWTGVALCALALYAVLSLGLEDVLHRTVLPTLRIGRGRTALRADLSQQVEEAAAEAGVRSQL